MYRLNGAVIGGRLEMVRIGSFLGSYTRKVSEMFDKLKGKKTYLVAALAAAGAVAQALGHPIPEYVWILLSAAGLGAVRSALGK
jgi:hypothetical protein